MLITENILRQIINEEILALEEELNEINFKKYAPYFMAGIAGIAAPKKAMAHNEPAAVTAQAGSSDVYGVVDGIEITEHAIEDCGGRENFNAVKGMLERAKDKIFRYFTNKEVIAKLLKTSKVKEIPADYEQRLEQALSLDSTRTETGDYKFLVASARDFTDMGTVHGAYYLDEDVLALNAASIKKLGGQMESVIEHEMQHKGYHAVQRILGVDLSKIHPPFRDFTNLDGSRQMQYLTDDSESSAYSFTFRDALNLGHQTSKQEIIDAFKGLGVNLQNIEGDIYSVYNLGTQSLKTQILSSLIPKLGQEKANASLRAILPFMVKINKDGMEYEGFDIEKLTNNLSTFATRDTSSSSRTAE